jgi:hypothetical protein
MLNPLYVDHILDLKPDDRTDSSARGGPFWPEIIKPVVARVTIVLFRTGNSTLKRYHEVQLNHHSTLNSTFHQLVSCAIHVLLAFQHIL